MSYADWPLGAPQDLERTEYWAALPRHHTLEDVTPGLVPRPRFVARSSEKRSSIVLIAALVASLALVIRLVLAYRSFDLFGDEVIYTRLGLSVFSGGFPRFGGRLFFLHPPGYFYLEAGWARLLGRPNSLVGQIYEMRTLNAVLSAATGAVLVLLGVRVSSRKAGIATGLIFALDPFCIRQNDRVLLETSMILWILLGYLVFSFLYASPPPPRARACAVFAGLLFGAAVLTKDEAALITVLPLGVIAALRYGPRRSLTLLTAATTLLCYATYVAVVAAGGHMAAMWQAKTSGFQRILGLVQTTGFHHAGTPSIYSRLLAEANYFSTTYIILALAAPALLVILRRGGPLARMVGLLYVVAGVTLAYGLVLGTLEEQELYILLVPSLLVLAVAGTLLDEGSRRSRRASRPARNSLPRAALAVTVLALVMAISLVTCVQWFSKPDDGYALLLRYMSAFVPAGTTVTAVDGTDEPGITQYALAYRYRVGRWVAPAELSENHVRYVVVPWTEISQHYSYFSTATVRKLVSGSKLLFSFHGRTYGDVTLYRLRSPHRQRRGR